MDLLGSLANPAIGNLLILIAAIIGVGGSYYVYQTRLEDRRTSARRAIKAELESMTFFTQWIEGSNEIPQQSVSTTKAYEGNIGNIGLLSEIEIDKLTLFYSIAIHVNEIIETNRDIILQSGPMKDVVDKGRSHRENVISSRIDRLAVWRWQSIQIIKKKLGEPHDSPEILDLPESSGDKIHSKHPFFKSNKNKLLSKNYIESVDGEPELYQLTNNGEDWINEIAKDDLGF